MRPNLKHKAMSNVTFAATAIVLLVVAAAGFGLYATRPQIASTTTQTITSTLEMTSKSSSMSESINGTMSSTMAHEALAFTPKQGQMIGNAWLLIEPAGMHGYALSIYAPGLETTTGTSNIYIVEGAQMTGSMASVPITGNATISEFQVGSNGVGQFFTLLNQNPYTGFENVQILFVPGMQMSNATLVATASLSMMNKTG